jgi:hypothetical protein
LLRCGRQNFNHGVVTSIRRKIESPTRSIELYAHKITENGSILGVSDRETHRTPAYFQKEGSNGSYKVFLNSHNISDVRDHLKPAASLRASWIAEVSTTSRECMIFT